MPKSSNDIYEQITNRVLDALSKGVAPWQKPWVGGAANAPRNLQSGKRYRGMNMILLGMSGYDDPRWTTFNAAKKMKGKVRKGERSTLVTLWKKLRVKDDTAPDGVKTVMMLRYYNVFNVEQVEWPEGAIRPIAEEAPPEGFEPLAHAEEVLLDYIDSDPELSLGWGSTGAWYIPSSHHIDLPDREQFKSIHGFYGTAFHECAHSTHKKLGRELGKGFGTDKYAREELVAEMTAAFVCTTLDVEGGFDNSVSYLKNWMERIGNDPKLIIQAAGKAQRAADLILGQMVTYTDETTTTADEADTALVTA